jgi:site-specific recombinase XerC
MIRFCRWLIDEDELNGNPMKGLRKPEIPEKPVPVLTDDELVMLIKACQGKDFADRRDEAIIRFLLDCGVRVSELCDVTLNDLDLDNGAALVTGKRGKKRWCTSVRAPNVDWIGICACDPATVGHTWTRCSSGSGARSPRMVFVTGWRCAPSRPG